MLPLGELETGHLQKVEEAETHHVGDGVVHLHQTLAKPGREQDFVLFDHLYFTWHASFNFNGKQTEIV